VPFCGAKISTRRCRRRVMSVILGHSPPRRLCRQYRPNRKYPTRSAECQSRSARCEAKKSHYTPGGERPACFEQWTPGNLMSKISLVLRLYDAAICPYLQHRQNNRFSNMTHQRISLARVAPALGDWSCDHELSAAIKHSAICGGD
jgi:hypothetical protein